MAQCGIVFRRFRIGRKAGFFETGYTLHELLVTLGIAGSLAATALPALRDLLLDNSLAVSVNRFRTDLALARNEASRRTHTVTLCKSRNGIGCEPRVEWHEGWIVFADPNDNGKLDPGEALILVQRGLTHGITLKFGAALNADNDVRYRPTGFSEKNGTFTFCDSRGPARARAIVLNFAGRPYVSTVKPSGDPLECRTAS